MNEAELADRTALLPEMFADRLPAQDLSPLHSMAGGGEWDELLDLLIAGLRVTGAAISGQERDELRAVLTGWGLPSEQLDGLVVRGR
jgi:hypothetical protein